MISSDVIIDADAILDFGSVTALQFAPGIKVRLQNGATASFSAGSISIGSGARFSSGDPGSSLYFAANATTIEAGAGGAPVKFVLRDSVEVGFFAEGDCTVNARADVSGTTDEGGAFYIQSYGNIAFTGKVVADGSKDGQFNAGVVDFNAAGTLQVDAKLRGRGYRPDSGQVSMQGSVVEVDGRIDVRPKAGVGGTVEITSATGNITVDAEIDAGGRRGSDDEGSNNCDGGSVDLTAAHAIVLDKKVSIRGGGPGGCTAGSFSAQAGADFSQGASAPIQATTPGFISVGGDIWIQAAGNVTLGKIDAGADNAGIIVASAGGTLTTAGQIKASSNGSGDAADGTISLSGRCGLDIPAGVGLKARQAASSGGQIGLITSGGPMTIAGKVEASAAVNLQYVTGFTPTVTGTVQPAPNLIEVPTGSCGS